MPNSFSYEEFIDQKPEIVFDLISDFADYKNFLPGCINSESISSSESFDIGRLEFNFFNKQYFIESKNYKTPGELNIKQIQGPFISLDAKWKVEQKDSGSMVYFYVEFNAPILLRPFMQQTLIDNFANKFIHAFLKRVR